MSKIASKNCSVILIQSFQINSLYFIFIILCLALMIFISYSLASDLYSPSLVFTINGFSEEHSFSAPMGVFYDKYHDEIYVIDTGNEQVDIFSIKGQPRFQMHRGLRSPIDAVVDSKNQVYISQIGKIYLELFNFRGENLSNLYAPNNAPLNPGRMCLDADESLYVADREKAKILVYDKDGKFKFQFGGKGEKTGEFLLISGIDVDSKGRIYVADSKQRPIQVFDSKGQFLKSIGEHGPDTEQFSLPGGICIDKSDNVWVVDTFKHHVKVFDSNGIFLFYFGAFGKESGKFFFPVDISIDQNNKIYVLDKGANRLQAFQM